MSRDRRIELIRAIEQKRGSKVITYITSDRPNLNAQIQGDAVTILHRHLLAISQAERQKLDLLIYSRGGDGDVPWGLVSMFREYSEGGTFNVLIPFRAHSAATVISIGADEIVMTKKAELGPIDSTLTTPFNPSPKGSPQTLPISVEDVMGYFSLLEKVSSNSPQDKTVAVQLISQQVHPIALGSIHRTLQQTELVTKRLLEARRNPLSEDQNAKILKMLSSEIYSHRHPIGRHEALAQLGMTFVVKAEDAQIDQELWQIYEEYAELFSLEDVFDPESEMLKNNTETASWVDLPITCVESVARCDVQLCDVKARRLKNAPPQVTINLANIGMPTINIPPGVNPAQIQQIIEQAIALHAQQALNTAVGVATEKILNSLPSIGIERSIYNIRWEDKS